MYVLIVGAALNGLSGFATVLFVGATAYIADVSSKEERAFRIAVMYVHVFLAGVISPPAVFGFKMWDSFLLLGSCWLATFSLESGLYSACGKFPEETATKKWLDFSALII